MSRTPGPWHIGLRPSPMIYGADSSQVADFRGDLLDSGEAQANARLIAAAPDLLAALEMIANSDKHKGGTFVLELQTIARAAIAKAKGE